MPRRLIAAALCSLLNAAGVAAAADPPRLKNLTGAPFLMFPVSEEAKACGITQERLVPQSTVNVMTSEGFPLTYELPGAEGLLELKYYLTVKDQVSTMPNYCMARISFGLEMVTRVEMPHLGAALPMHVPLWEISALAFDTVPNFMARRTAMLDLMAKNFVQAWKAANPLP